MKKRFLSVALIAGLILSMTGCSGNAETVVTTKSGEVTTTTAATTAKAETAETTTAADTEEVTTEAVTETTTTTAPEEPEETKLMTSEPKFFDDGCMVFRDVTDTCIYNITENELYVHNEAENGRILSVSGNIAIIDANNDPYRKIDRDGCESIQDVNIVNLKTGEIIVSCTQDNNTYCYLSYDDDNPLEWASSYIPLVKVDKGFSGDKYSYGVLNNKGEWVHPMSADYEICKIGITYAMLVNEEQWIFASNGDYYYYNIKDNKFSDISAAVEEQMDYVAYDIGISLGDNKPVVAIITPSVTERYHYDHITNTFDEIVLEAEMERRDEYFLCGKHIYDSGYNKYNYDLSEYNVRKISALSEDYIIFTAMNDNFDDYEIIMKKDGSFVCEPFMGSAFLKGDSVIISQYVNEQAEWSILDCKTGEISKLAYEYDSYDSTSGMLVVKSDNAYYLLDPEAPDTLINPFEIAE